MTNPLDRLHELATAGEFAHALVEAAAFTSEDPAEAVEAACIRNWCHSRLGNDAGAYAGARTVADQAATVLGPDHPATLDAHNDLARFAFRLGHVDEAVEIGCRVAAGRLNLLGALHPKTLTSMTNLVRYRWQRGDRGCLTLTDGLLTDWAFADPQHTNSAHLATLLLRAEILADLAETAATDTVDRFRALHGSDHPNTRRAESALGR